LRGGNRWGRLFRARAPLARGKKGEKGCPEKSGDAKKGKDTYRLVEEKLFLGGKTLDRGKELPKPLWRTQAFVQF